MGNIGIPFKNEEPENKEILEEDKNNTQIDKETKDYITQAQENPDNEIFLLTHFDSIKRDIQSIFYFFDNFPNDKNWNKILSPKYKDLCKDNIKQYLKELKDKKIYDYEYENNNKSQKSFYIKLFNYLYGKKEAFEFLIQRHDNIDLLFGKIDHPNATLSVIDINDTIACVEFFKEITRFEKNEDIFNFIKEKLKGNENLMRSFKNFSEIYPIIKLNDDFLQESYDIIIKIVKDTEIIFLQNKEEIIIKETN